MEAVLLNKIDKDNFICYFWDDSYKKYLAKLIGVKKLPNMACLLIETLMCQFKFFFIFFFFLSS